MIKNAIIRSGRHKSKLYIYIYIYIKWYLIFDISISILSLIE